MGRNRGSRRDRDLPQYVYRVPGRDRVIWREYLGRGRFGRKVTLSGTDGRPLRAGASAREIREAWQRIDTQGALPGTLDWLLEQYFQSVRFADLAAATQKNYRVLARTISRAGVAGGRTFGSVRLDSLSRGVIAKYRDRRAGARVAANRELQFLSALFSWACERDIMESNPARGVRRFPTQPRDRYITDSEFRLVQDIAPDYVAVAMELAYCCRARRSEVLALRREHVTDQGVYVDRKKGSESEVTEWSPALEGAVAAARALHRDVISPWLLHGPDGDPIKEAAFSTAWRRLMDRAMRSGLQTRFTFHDIKAKGVTDHSEQWAGHLSPRMREVYIRQSRKVPSTR